MGEGDWRGREGERDHLCFNNIFTLHTERGRGIGRGCIYHFFHIKHRKRGRLGVRGYGEEIGEEYIVHRGEEVWVPANLYDALTNSLIAVRGGGGVVVVEGKGRERERNNEREREMNQSSSTIPSHSPLVVTKRHREEGQERGWRGRSGSGTVKGRGIVHV